MPPYYKEVYIPDAAAERFEAYVRTEGGVVGERVFDRRDTSDDLNSVWASQVSQGRWLLRGFTAVREEPIVSQRINQGVQDLIDSAASHSSRLPRRRDISIDVVKQELAIVFRDSLSDAPPPDVSLIENQGRQYPTFKSHSKYVGLLPRQVIYLIEYYGLENGVKKSQNEIGNLYGTTNVRDVIYSATRRISRHPKIRELIFDTS